MTTANKITVLRLFLVPVFAGQLIFYLQNGNEWHRLAALISFALAAISDGVDGYIARRYNQKSELGAILDPMADKLLLVSAILILTINPTSHLQKIPGWLTWLILTRDLFLVLGIVILHYTFGRIKVRPHLSGKLATVLIMIIVLWCLLQWNAAWLQVFIYVAGFFTLLSSAQYFMDWIRQLNSSPTSAPSPKQDE